MELESCERSVGIMKKTMETNLQVERRKKQKVECASQYQK
jgi:hypothetical protein